jgi:alpha-beta hydrolase superfamily lysophospholipase/acetylornithine deacetylase/succinyl-diaminopimelate desuccinylase-like protein
MSRKFEFSYFFSATPKKKKKILEKMLRLFGKRLLSSRRRFAFADEGGAVKEPSFALLDSVKWPSAADSRRAPVDRAIARLALKYKDLASEILAEAVRIPEDHVARDPLNGTSNHERERLEYLRNKIVECGAVRSQEDVFFDGFGNLVWLVSDDTDGVPISDKVVVYFDGHTDTVYPLPDEWRRKSGGGLDVYKGLVDADKVDVAQIRNELGYLPDADEFGHLLFGRGTADQLSGVVQQIVATKIMLELHAEHGLLDGVVVRSYGTVAEEDNDGGGPMYVIKEVLPKHPELLPDCVVHTEGTGDTRYSPLGIYIGQRGRMQIEVEVVGKSCHGSMPELGKNPLEYGALIIVQARQQFDALDSFDHDAFLGGGTRVASWAKLASPSDCAVPASFVFRFDRRLTVGEDPQSALDAIESLPGVAEARERGLAVNVSIPRYDEATWRGYSLKNEATYMGWCTPPAHEAVVSAYDAWQRVVDSDIVALTTAPDSKHPLTPISETPRLGRWVFSTDGVGYVVPKDGAGALHVPPHKRWVDVGTHRHPPMIGIGIGFEQNTHKIGEFIDTRHFPAACAVMARFPSLFRERRAATPAQHMRWSGSGDSDDDANKLMSSEGDGGATAGSFVGASGSDIFWQRFSNSNKQPPRVAVLVAHGWAEHSGRYAQLAQALSDGAGAVVYGIDHQGHGRSGGERVLIQDFDDSVADMHHVVTQCMPAEHQSLPLVCIGHSMGGLLTARYAQTHPSKVSGAAFLGAVLGQWDWIDSALHKADGNEFIPGSAANVAGMSRDEAAQRQYADDELVYHGLVKTRLIEAEKRALDAMSANLNALTMPLCCLHGSADPFVPFSKSISTIASCPSQHISLRVYEGARHELVHEQNREQVFDDLIAFLNSIGK